MRKKINGYIFALLIFSIFSCTAFAATKSASVTISKTQFERTSKSIGYAKKANYKGNNDKSSVRALNIDGYAAWANWPRSLEHSVRLAKGKACQFTVTQSRISSFQIGLRPQGSDKVSGCKGSGKVWY